LRQRLSAEAVKVLEEAEPALAAELQAGVLQISILLTESGATKSVVARFCDEVLRLAARSFSIQRRRFLSACTDAAGPELSQRVEAALRHQE
jgi:hypothetical protein